MRRSLTAAVLLSLSGLAVPGQAAQEPAARRPRARAVPPAPIPVTGLYSSLAYNAEGGDLLGMEVYIVPDGRGAFYATVQCAGGEPARPVLVPVQTRELHIEFTLPSGLPDCGTRFVGTVSARGLRGKFAGERGERWLPRKASYWQQ